MRECCSLRITGVVSCFLGNCVNSVFRVCTFLKGPWIIGLEKWDATSMKVLKNLIVDFNVVNNREWNIFNQQCVKL